MHRTGSLRSLVLLLGNSALAACACNGKVLSTAASAGGATGLQLALSTSSVVLAPGATFTFTASVTGLGSGQSSAVSWSVQEGAPGGTINGAGTYTAPSSPGHVPRHRDQRRRQHRVRLGGGDGHRPAGTAPFA